MSDTINTFFRDPDRGFRSFHRSEIVSPDSDGKWVPNVNDLVIDYIQGFFRVSEVDYTTGYSVLVPWELPKEAPEDRNLDVLIAYGPGYPSESYRMFLDTSTTPFNFTPDSQLHFYGSMVDSYKVFLGSDISDEHGTVISSFIDSSGNFLGTSVPVETVVVPNAIQDVIKAPVAGYTTSRLDDGELVTLVAYSDDGGVVSRAQLLVQNSATARQSDNAKRYVKGIQIESPFLSSADPQTIEFPLNVTVESLPLTAVVHYSTGGRQRYPVDGVKFSLFGLRNYVATVVGQKFPMVLSYNLSDDEVSYLEEPSANRTMTKPYQAMTTTVDGSYEVKLFMYPRWVSPSHGYRLEYWLYNLNRQTYYQVTHLIEVGSTSNAFDPTLYGTTQRMTVALDLNKVDAMFAPYRHVQNFQVSLLSPGNEHSDNWEIFFTSEQAEGFGRGLVAAVDYVNTNDWYLLLSNGYPSKETWLRAMYERIEPLVDRRRETYPPTPTHFVVRFTNNTYEFTVDQWNEDLLVNNDLNDGELVYLHFLQRNYDTDLQLGVTALPIRQLID